MKKYQLICMSFDGAYQRETPEFDTIEQVAEYANNLGSKWFFYPFIFPVKGNTITDSWEPLEFLKGKRINTVAKLFKQYSEKPEAQGLDANDFPWFVATHYRGMKHPGHRRAETMKNTTLLGNFQSVSQFNGHNGAVKNQFIIQTDKGLVFQSYNTIIAAKISGKRYLDKNSWDYSVTTGKYRNQFLGETKKETEAKIKSGEYILTDLNGGE